MCVTQDQIEDIEVHSCRMHGGFHPQILLRTAGRYIPHVQTLAGLSFAGSAPETIRDARLSHQEPTQMLLEQVSLSEAIHNPHDEHFSP